MWVRILGAAAGGGVPQWNCACANCRAVRHGSGRVRARTQSSVAVSGDRDVWFLLNVSPDVRAQILAFPELAPREPAQRGTRIGGCVLTDAELDHTLGLLSLREGEEFEVAATPAVQRWLREELAVTPVLAAFCARAWRELQLDQPLELVSPQHGPSGVRVRAFETGRRPPHYVRAADAEAPGAVVGLILDDERTGGRCVYAPSAAGPSPALQAAVDGVDCVLLDGTFWSDDELSQARPGANGARTMGHWPVGGSEGSLAWMRGLRARHRAYVHVNNTNPMLARGSAEQRAVLEAGVSVGADGDGFRI